MPQKKSTGKKKPVTAYIGVGSNIAPEKNIPKALKLLADRASIIATSTFYRTRPLDGRRQPEYRNGVWRIETDLSPRALKNEILKDIEKKLKRVRTKDRYASRTIDLDLLLYGGTASNEEGLTIPDPDIYQRRFIAAGLFELDPRLRLPDTKAGIKTVLKRIEEEPLRPDSKLTDTLRTLLADYTASTARQTHLWRFEYETLRGINLSFTQNEPASVALFRELIGKKLIHPPRKILDIGCGKGRIGIHLARAGFDVTGFDIVRSAVGEFQRIAEATGVEGKVEALVGDINNRWEVPDQSFDCAFAVTVIDNLLTRRARMHFTGELLRILSPGGLFVVECYSEKDGYYGKLLSRSGRKSGIVFDPNNNMRFRIYSERELLALFSPHFSLVHHENAGWQGVKYRRRYDRHSGIWIFKKAEPQRTH